MSQIDQFRALYEKHDYGAAKKWLVSNQQDFTSDIFHYNMGTVEFKLKQFAKSRYHFETAQSQGMWTPALTKNLETVSEKLGVKEIESASNFQDFWFQYGVGVSYQSLIIFGLCILLIALILKLMKKVKLSFVTLLIILAFLPTALKYTLFNSYYYAIPLSPQGVFEGPSKVFERSTELPVGAKLIIKDTEQNWSQVVSPSKAAGWIEKSQFKAIKL